MVFPPFPQSECKNHCFALVFYWMQNLLKAGLSTVLHPIKNPAQSGILTFIRGAGGNRTLVQTTARWAFYMLSRSFGCRPRAGEGRPTRGLGPVSRPRSGPPRGPASHGRHPEAGKEGDGPRRGVLVHATVIHVDEAEEPWALRQRARSLLRQLWRRCTGIRAAHHARHAYRTLRSRCRNQVGPRWVSGKNVARR